MRLLAVADAAEVLPPGCLLGIAKEIRPGDMVVMPELATAQAGEIGLRRIGASNTDFTERYSVRGDVSDLFPFLVTKLSPYYDK